MSGPNGHAEEHRGDVTVALPAPIMPTETQFSREKIKELVAALEVPFEVTQIEWRVMNTPRRTGTR
jgi:hypothetical protein